jgi:hypothetical protein
MRRVDVMARDRMSGRVRVVHHYASPAAAEKLIAKMAGGTIVFSKRVEWTDYELFTRWSDEAPEQQVLR